MALKADPTTPQVARKAAVIDEIKGKLRDADAAVLTEYRGLTVTDIAALRAVLRPAGTEYKIYKNTLVKRAAEEVGVGDDLATMLTGPVAIAFVSGDAAAAAKALRDFARTNQHLVLKGGLLGDRPLAGADIDALAELPSRDGLLSQLAGLFEAPMAQTLGLFEAVLRDTVGLVQALVDQRVAAGEAPPPESPAASADAAAEAATTDAPSDAPSSESAEAAEARDGDAVESAEAPSDGAETAAAPADAAEPAADDTGAAD
jgi:large subunit ribosomal protein L10